MIHLVPTHLLRAGSSRNSGSNLVLDLLVLNTGLLGDRGRRGGGLGGSFGLNDGLDLVGRGDDVRRLSLGLDYSRSQSGGSSIENRLIIGDRRRLQKPAKTVISPRLYQTCLLCEPTFESTSISLLVMGTSSCFLVSVSTLVGV